MNRSQQNKAQLQSTERDVVTNKPQLVYCNNKIKTSKYTAFNFIFKNLFEQFQKLPNVYFLLISFLQMIPEITISNGAPANLPPLAFILIVTAMKDLFEDLKRHRSDTSENNKPVEKLNQNGTLEKVRWLDLRVGDIIKIKKDEYFPADVMILRTSETKNDCYIETKNLDGETNLKNKGCAKDLKDMIPVQEKELARLQGRFVYELPNPYLYKFTGTYLDKEQKIPIDFNNFILRGCSLRNTKYIYGLVSYTGHDTKLLLNSVNARTKRSQVDRQLNSQVKIIFMMQMIFCVISSIISASLYEQNKAELSTYIDEINPTESKFFLNFVVKYGNWLLMFTNFVPISLLVTVDVVKFVQGIIIQKDEKMMTDVEGEKIYVNVQSSQLNEELGQVQYIFSDKTGTLTCNKMDFKNLTVNGVSYGDARDIKQEQQQKCNQVTNVDFQDQSLFDDLKESDNKDKLEQNLKFLAICHTILVENGDNGEMIYNASSPDELALVNFARYVGYQFIGIDQNGIMTIQIEDRQQKYQLLNVLEFTSARKRQSVVVKDLENQEIWLMSKGADSVLEKRMSNANSSEKHQIWDNLDKYANQGLRTLVLCQKKISEQQYKEWSETYNNALTIIDQMREQRIEQVQSDLEQDLELIGATAIEDKLQDQVGETIRYIRNAGINLWVLTGDKIETAINIGFSCQLLDNTMEKVIVDGIEFEAVQRSLNDAHNMIKQLGDVEYALVVSGDALIQIMNDANLKASIFEITKKCKSVLACRVSPKQKMEIVQMVRDELPKVTTLSIGDGANDVNMITAAHVGIGIKGVEGHQAARASDYSIGEFKHLRKLTLYYGRENYRKNTTLIIYNFYKNMVYVVPQFWLAILNQFSGQNMFDPFIYQLYNIAYASLPIMLYGLLDEEYEADYLMKNTEHYKQGMFNELFNTYTFWRGVINGIIQAMIITLPTFYILENGNFLGSDGTTFHFWATGIVVFSAVVYVTNFKIFLVSNTLNVLQIVIIFGSILFYYLNFGLVSGYAPSFDIYETFSLSFNCNIFYLVFIVHVFSTSIFELFCNRIIGYNYEAKQKNCRKEYNIIENDQKINKNDKEVKQSKSKKNRPLHRGFSFSQSEPIDKVKLSQQA